ncbi:MAG TPA: ATP-binding protein [Chromobacteriaceae bacterium]|nr:ATP-binding protein [Chromobacteriaceae bacterium]
MEYRRLQGEFERSARLAHGMVARKLDQNESVLSAIDAFQSSRPDLNLGALRTFSRQMIAHYPQLYTVEFFQHVTRQSRPAFLKAMTARLGASFFIRDYDLDGRRSWQPSPDNRDQYLVVTMMEPDLPSANPVYGFDVLNEKHFSAPIRQALLTGRKTSTPPFELYEGGKAYMLVKPLYLGHAGEARAGAAGRELVGMAALLIYCEKLMKLPGSDLDFYLKLRQNHAGRQPFYASHHHASHADWWPVLFRLEMELPVGGEAQPFLLGVAKEVRTADLHILSLLLANIAILVLFVSAWWSYLQRQALKVAQQQADEAIFFQSERAAVTLNAIHDGVITLRQDQTIEMINPMALALVGLPASEVVGRAYQDVFRLLNELAAELAEDPISECFHTGRSVEFPDRMQLASAKGQVRLVEGAVAPLFSRDGQLTGVVCALRDMGPIRQRAAEALAASELRVKEHLEKLSHVARLHTMGEMASGIAHELNQPLTAISNYCQASLQLMEMVEEPVPQVESALRLAVAQANRAGEIIKRLRALVSKRAMETRLVDLNQVVGNCMFLAEYDFKARGIEVVQLLYTYSVPVMADSIQLEQVLLNLLSNAMDALADEPSMKRHIIVHTRREGGKAILEVRDTGRGITPEILEVLFHPFFSTKEHGMGLGLSICQTIVEQYGGLISAENILASGACFRIELPLSLNVERRHPS